MANIMIVEDEGLIALELQESLESAGYSVPFVVTNGEEAVQKAIEHKPDLILMDIYLQGKMNGIEAAMAIHGQCDIPIIYITAYSEINTIERAKITNPYGYILKPIDEKTLHINVKMALHNSDTDEQLRKTKEWLLDVLTKSQTAVIITDNQGHIQFANRNAEKICEYDTTRLTGKFVFDILQVIDEQNSFLDRDTVKEFRLNGDMADYSGSTILFADGTKESIDLSVNPIFRDDGSILGFIIYIRLQKPVFSDEDNNTFEKQLYDPVIKEKKALASFLEMEIALLTLKVYDEGNKSNSRSAGQLDAYKNVLRYYFGDHHLERLEAQLRR